MSVRFNHEAFETTNERKGTLYSTDMKREKIKDRELGSRLRCQVISSTETREPGRSGNARHICLSGKKSPF
jgi:hypothetical protein